MLHRAFFKGIVTVALLGLTVLGLSAATFPTRSATSSFTIPHASPIVNSNVKHDVSPPLRTIKPVHHAAKGHDMEGDLPRLPVGAPNGIPDNVQSTPSAPLTPSPSNSFDGIGNGFSGPSGTFTV